MSDKAPRESDGIPWLRLVWDSAPDAMVLSDGEGVVLMANAAYCALYGYEPEDVIAHSFAIIFPTERRGEALDQYRAVFTVAHDMPTYETSIVRRDGSERFVQARATVISLDGRPRALLSIIRDITERRISERLQREFLALASHELKNPLSAISGNAQLLQRRGVYQEDRVGRIIAQAAHMNRLLGDLLDVSRLESGRLQLQTAPMDLVELARSCTEQARAQTDARVLRFEPAVDRLVGVWDADRLRQVLDNLLTNAIKYSPNGGEIVVEVADDGHHARVAVSDQGVGIAPSALRSIFERFFRTEDAVTRTTGVGIGLYVVKSIVDLHGGQITAASDEGRGTTMTFTLPYGPQATGAA